MNYFTRPPTSRPRPAAHRGIARRPSVRWRTIRPMTDHTPPPRRSWLTWPRTLALLLTSYLIAAAAPLLPAALQPLVPLSLAMGAGAWALQMTASLRSPRPTRPLDASASRMDRAAAWTARHSRPLMWWLVGYALAVVLAQRLDAGTLADVLRITGLVQAGVLAVLIAHQQRGRDD